MQQKPFSDIEFNQYLSKEKLMGAQCKKCGRIFVPPRPICIDCHESEIEWVQMSGQGKLAGFTCITIGPSFMRAEGYDRKNPYCVGVVELKEGGRVDARIENVDATQPETIKMAMPLRVKFLHRGEGEDKKTFLAFEPA
jgi:uncharacterized OB-fold protein